MNGSTVEHEVTPEGKQKLKRWSLAIETEVKRFKQEWQDEEVDIPAEDPPDSLQRSTDVFLCVTFLMFLYVTLHSCFCMLFFRRKDSPLF